MNIEFTTIYKITFNENDAMLKCGSKLSRKPTVLTLSIQQIEYLNKQLCKYVDALAARRSPTTRRYTPTVQAFDFGKEMHHASSVTDKKMVMNHLIPVYRDWLRRDANHGPPPPCERTDVCSVSSDVTRRQLAPAALTVTTQYGLYTVVTTW
ncbi:hypothetical protein SFRURICE_005264 [Spodoptera frugiperda]|nr:hypothetical protein SFRURICE_005264 [Spodoptera frugiperda]